MTCDGYYILAPDGRTPVLVNDIHVWGRWRETSNRHVAKDTIKGVTVSTVFLTVDHRFGQVGPPILWETLVFGGVCDGEMERYTTYDQAAAGHAAMLEKVRLAEMTELERAVYDAQQRGTREDGRRD